MSARARSGQTAPAPADQMDALGDDVVGQLGRGLTQTTDGRRDDLVDLILHRTAEFGR